MLLFPKNLSIDNYQKAQVLTQTINKFNEIILLNQVKTAIKQQIFYQHTLKSSLFSAKIEGNQLTLADVSQLNLNNPKAKNQQEVSNVLHTLDILHQLAGKLTSAKLKKIHSLVMNKIDCNAGKFRHEDSAIFDQFGNVVYLTPNPQEMLEMLVIFEQHFNQLKQVAINELCQQLITCCQLHYYFEKIHPFIDGNGRTGRVLLHLALKKIGIAPDWILPIDQYIRQYRSDYYALLNKSSRQIDDFILFLFEALVWAMQDLITSLNVSQLNNTNNTNHNLLARLLPRRAEIFYIIRDHPYISLDSIARRFPTVSQRTIACDVNYLIKKGFLIKHGETRGATYSILKQLPACQT